MSGNEIIGKEEPKNLREIFTKSNGFCFHIAFIKGEIKFLE